MPYALLIACEARPEALISPFMFPNGVGFHKGQLYLSQYLNMRCAAFFTMFTLFKPYILIMYQIKYALPLADYCQSSVLESSLLQTTCSSNVTTLQQVNKMPSSML
jgi:hypothetical protein